MLHDRRPELKQGHPPAEANGLKSEYIQVRQGECQICDQESVVLTALLGSCVAACIWDPVARAGGMNHILLPGNTVNDRDALYSGTNAMEVLINGLLRKGATHKNMKVKLLGGAKMYDGVFDVGRRNSDFGN